MADPQNQVWKLFPATAYPTLKYTTEHTPCSAVLSVLASPPPSPDPYVHTLPPAPAFTATPPPVCCQRGPASVSACLLAVLCECSASFPALLGSCCRRLCRPLTETSFKFIPFSSRHPQPYFLRALHCLPTSLPLQPDLCIQLLAEWTFTEAINNLSMVKSKEAFSGVFFVSLSGNTSLFPSLSLGICFLGCIHYMGTRQNVHK